MRTLDGLEQLLRAEVKLDVDLMTSCGELVEAGLGNLLGDEDSGHGCSLGGGGSPILGDQRGPSAGEELLEPNDAFHKLLIREGIGKPDVARSPKGLAGDDRHLDLIDDQLRQFG